MKFGNHRDPQVTLARVRKYMATANLQECTLDEVSEQVFLSRTGLAWRIEKAGSSWGAEKLAERRRRLNILLEQGGRLDVHGAASWCGFSYPDSFLNFFRKTMGMNLTQYRLTKVSS